MHLKALKKRYLNYLALLVLLSSCSFGYVKQDLETTSYSTSGMEQFFLPELPNWANYSELGRCYKSSSFQYMDFSRLSANYELSYAEMVELQGQFNERREHYFSTTAHKFLKPVEESSLFSNTLEQVRAGVRVFKIPSTAEVEVVWLEGFLQQNKLEELKGVIKSGRFDERPPILFSSCLSRHRLQKWVAENGLEQAGFYLLSAEWLTPFDQKSILGAGMRLDVSKLLAPGTKVRILVPEKTISPLELFF
jgi:hypothetical protein